MGNSVDLRLEDGSGELALRSHWKAPNSQDFWDVAVMGFCPFPAGKCGACGPGYPSPLEAMKGKCWNRAFPDPGIAGISGIGDVSPRCPRRAPGAAAVPALHLPEHRDQRSRLPGHRGCGSQIPSVLPGTGLGEPGASQIQENLGKSGGTWDPESGRICENLGSQIREPSGEPGVLSLGKSRGIWENPGEPGILHPGRSGLPNPSRPWQGQQCQNSGKGDLELDPAPQVTFHR